MADMWQRFTNPATRVIHFAQEEAKRVGMNVVGTEHILVGFLREGEGVAARVLERLGVDLCRVRTEMDRQLGTLEHTQASSGRLTLSAKAKKALEYSLEEARELNPRLGLQNFVDTEHILLGLIREGEYSGSKAVRMLDGLGVDPERIHREVLNYMGIRPAEETAASEQSNVDIWLSLSEPAFRILTLAGEEANRQGTNVIDAPHLAAGLLRFNEAALARQNVLMDQVRAALFGQPAVPGAAAPTLSPQCADVLGLAYQAALKDTPSGALARITPEQLTQGLLDGAEAFEYDTVRKLTELGIDLERFKAEL